MLLPIIGLAAAVFFLLASPQGDAAAHANLGNLLRDKGDYVEAESFYREALALRENALGRSAPDVAETLTEYAKLLRILGRDDEAGRLEARVEAIRGK